MTNKRVLLGLTGLGVLGLAAIVGAIMSWTWLIVVGLVGMAAVIGVVVLNTNLLVRAGRADIVKVRAAMTKAAVPDATPLDESLSPEANLLETVRLLQSQYVGRLDRAQSAFERAAATLTKPFLPRSPATRRHPTARLIPSPGSPAAALCSSTSSTRPPLPRPRWPSRGVSRSRRSWPTAPTGSNWPPRESPTPSLRWPAPAPRRTR